MNGILMTSDNHQAIRELRKTQTRRTAGLKEINKQPDIYRFLALGSDGAIFQYRLPSVIGETVVKARYHVGEVVYIKEAHYLFGKWWWAHGDDSDDVRFTWDPSKPIYYADTKPTDLIINRGHFLLILVGIYAPRCF